MFVDPPAQIVPPPETEPDGGTENGIARESLALHVPRVASTATVTGSEVPTNDREFVPCPETIVPFVTVQTYVAPVVRGTEAVAVRPAQTRAGTVSAAEGVGFTVTTAEPVAVPAQIVSATVRTVYVVVERGVTTRVAGLGGEAVLGDAVGPDEGPRAGTGERDGERRALAGAEGVATGQGSRGRRAAADVGEGVDEAPDVAVGVLDLDVHETADVRPGDGADRGRGEARDRGRDATEADDGPRLEAGAGDRDRRPADGGAGDRRDRRRFRARGERDRRERSVAARRRGASRPRSRAARREPRTSRGTRASSCRSRRPCCPSRRGRACRSRSSAG